MDKEIFSELCLDSTWEATSLLLIGNISLRSPIERFWADFWDDPSEDNNINNENEINELSNNYKKNKN